MILCCLALKKDEFQKGIAKVKIKDFPGATIDDLHDYIKAVLKKCPDNMLHVGNNNTVNEPSKMVLDKLLNLKRFIEHTLPESYVVISN